MAKEVVMEAVEWSSRSTLQSVVEMNLIRKGYTQSVNEKESSSFQIKNSVHFIRRASTDRLRKQTGGGVKLFFFEIFLTARENITGLRLLETGQKGGCG